MGNWPVAVANSMKTMHETETLDPGHGVTAFHATTPLGLELLLADELTQLGATQVVPGRAGVAFEGRMETAYRACLWSRLANRILWPLARFPAATIEQLYAGVRGVEWSRYLDTDTVIAVDFASSRSAITHTLFGAQKVKDAVVDHFMDLSGKRPSVDLSNPDLRINLYLDRDQATLSLDLSGDSLHRRGYRLEGGKAPLKENLAAAILIRAGWPDVAKAGGSFLDLMCGSGTLPIEAALMASDTAPGLLRSWYGFMAMPDHDPNVWLDLREEAQERSRKGRESMPLIRGSDIDRRALSVAKANLERSGFADQVLLSLGDVADARPEGPIGLVVSNPPYGERLGDEESLVPLYRVLGETLRAHFEGYRASLFTANPELAFKLGIRARKQYALYNGSLPCKLLNFEISSERHFTPAEGGPLSPEEREQRKWLRKLREVDLTSGGAEMVANRLRKNLRNLGRWARQNDISCYRLYDADLPEYAMAVDLYLCEGVLRAHVQEYEAPSTVDPVRAEQRLIEFMAALPAVLEIPPEQVILKVRKRQKGLNQYEKQSEKGHFLAVQEGGLKFRVNLEDYLDTGLFLDHRVTRQLIGSMASKKRFLNLFAYTGSATVHAAAGGATSTLSVDLSNTYLDWAEANMALNGFTGEAHRYLRADCLAWLDQAAKDSARFDLIFLDPPTFSTSKRMAGTLDVQRDHVGMIRAAMAILAPGGRLVFTTNQRKFKLDRSALEDLAIEDISAKTLPKDFERNPRIHMGWILHAKAD